MGGAKAECCECWSFWSWSTALAEVPGGRGAQQEPNMNVSTHMPMWRPSLCRHSHTNMHVPASEPARHGFWLML